MWQLRVSNYFECTNKFCLEAKRPQTGYLKIQKIKNKLSQVLGHYESTLTSKRELEEKVGHDHLYCLQNSIKIPNDSEGYINEETGFETIHEKSSVTFKGPKSRGDRNKLDVRHKRSQAELLSK